MKVGKRTGQPLSTLFWHPLFTPPPSLTNILPRYMNCSTCLSVSPSKFMSHEMGSLLVTITSAVSLEILTPLFCIACLGLIPSPEVYSDPLLSALSHQSANISSSVLFSSLFARFMMLSIHIMNIKGDNTHPCLNPHFTSNHSVSPSLVLTASWLHILCRETGRPSQALRKYPVLLGISKVLLLLLDRMLSLDRRKPCKVVCSTQCASLVVVLRWISHQNILYSFGIQTGSQPDADLLYIMVRVRKDGEGEGRSSRE